MPLSGVHTVEGMVCAESCQLPGLAAVWPGASDYASPSLGFPGCHGRMALRQSACHAPGPG